MALFGFLSLGSGGIFIYVTALRESRRGDIPARGGRGWGGRQRWVWGQERITLLSLHLLTFASGSPYQITGLCMSRGRMCECLF